MAKVDSVASNEPNGPFGLEAKLWAAADALRNNMDAAEYKHVVLGLIINLISGIALGSAVDRAKDTLGRVYEYFLARFASAEGRSGGEFYTPSHVVRVLVEMLAPYKGRVYDPCCGSGGMFVQSEKFIEAHSGRRGDISI
jgi:type I restriction-modification system DNA methylase subunit